MAQLRGASYLSKKHAISSNRQSAFHYRYRAASLTGYGLIVGLIAIAAIAAVSNVGDEVSSLFGSVSEQMAGVNSGVGGVGSESGSGNTPPVAGSTVELTAFAGGDSDYPFSTLLAGATDADDDPLTITGISDITGGTAIIATGTGGEDVVRLDRPRPARMARP